MEIVKGAFRKRKHNPCQIKNNPWIVGSREGEMKSVFQLVDKRDSHALAQVT